MQQNENECIDEVKNSDNSNANALTSADNHKLLHFDSLVPDEMVATLNRLITCMDARNSIQIYAFLINLQDMSLKVPSSHHANLKMLLNELVSKNAQYLPPALRNHKLHFGNIIDEGSVRKIPFNVFISNYLLSLLVKLTIKEIENAVNNYFYPENRQIVCGIESVIKNGYEVLFKEIDTEPESDSVKRVKLNENGMAVSTADKEKERMAIRKKMKDVLTSNRLLFAILRDDDYNINMFNVLVSFEEKIRDYLLYLYINYEQTYQMFLKNVAQNCTPEQQIQILEYFIEVKIEQLKHFDIGNLKHMVKKRMGCEYLKAKIKEKEKSEILEIMKGNFKFFKDDLSYYGLAFKDLLTLASDENEVLEYLFDNLWHYGSHFVGAVMKALADRDEKYIFRFFNKRIDQMKTMENGNGAIAKETDAQSVTDTAEHAQKDTADTKQFDYIHDAIIIFLKHNKPSKPLLKLFRSEALLGNKKYFLSIITLLDTEIVKDNIFEYLDAETLPFFSRALTANEIIHELCIFNPERYGSKYHKPGYGKDRLARILEEVVPQLPEDALIQTLAQSDNTPNFFMVLKCAVAAFDVLRPFTLTALQRHTEKSSAYINVLELMDVHAVDVLACKDKNFIYYVLRRSNRLREVCLKNKNKNIRGMNKIVSVLRQR